MKLYKILFAGLAVVMFANCEEPITKKECGIIVFTDANGHGLASAPTDLPFSDWNVAKQACEDLVLDGCTDWRLPTRDELNQLYLNKDKIGGFGKFDSYWSSTEVGGNSAFTVEFDNGVNAAAPTNTKSSVRAVRAF
jgi:hypothetical protein